MRIEGLEVERTWANGTCERGRVYAAAPVEGGDDGWFVLLVMLDGGELVEWFAVDCRVLL